MTKLDRAYVAGLFDGEGCLSWYRGSPRVTITSCYPHHLKWIKASLGYGSVVVHEKSKNPARQSYRFQAWGSNALRFIAAIRPHLKEKAYQADILMMLERSMPRTAYRTRLLKSLSEAKRIEYV